MIQTAALLPYGCQLFRVYKFGFRIMDPLKRKSPDLQKIYKGSNNDGEYRALFELTLKSLEIEDLTGVLKFY